MCTRWENFIRIGITVLYLKSCQCQLWICTASKTAFATIKSTIDTSNSSNTVLLFLKQQSMVRYITPLKQQSMVRYITPLKQQSMVRYIAPLKQQSMVRYIAPLQTCYICCIVSEDRYNFINFNKSQVTFFPKELYQVASYH